jgi:pyridoxamine 5'-phosphate oxidase
MLAEVSMRDKTELTDRLYDDAFTGEIDPFVLFETWLEEAQTAEINDPNAMAVATVDAVGLPDVRMILLNGRDARGFVFFTNRESRKGLELLAHPKAALVFHWKSIRRQIRIRGEVEEVAPAEADAYFATRPRRSQIGAHASAQSRPLASRAELVARADNLEENFEGKDVPRPAYWSGFRVKPIEMEFWKDGEFRLHDRIRFHRETPEGSWTRTRLNP